MKKYIITTVTFFLILVGCSTDDSGIENIDGNDPDPIPNVFNRQKSSSIYLNLSPPTFPYLVSP